MIAQLIMAGSLGLNLAHSEPFYEHRAVLGVRYRHEIGALRLRIGGVLGKTNGFPFRQVIQVCPCPGGREPSGSTFSHWAAGADYRVAKGTHLGLAYLRQQWDLPRTAPDQAIYYTALAATLEHWRPEGFVRLERQLKVLAQWRLAASRTMIRGRAHSGPWWASGTIKETVGLITRWTGFVGAGWRVFGIEAGSEALPSVHRLGQVTNEFVRVVLVFSVST